MESKRYNGIQTVYLNICIFLNEFNVVLFLWEVLSDVVETYDEPVNKPPKNVKNEV